MAIVVIVLVLVLFGLNEVTKKTSLKKIFYKREFSKQAVEIGEEFNITAIIENQNIFPVSFLHIIEQVHARLTYKFAKTEFMRSFYMAFPNWNALRANLSWTHYRMLLKIEDEKARQFYLDECARSNWSTRQLDRQINSFYYQRLLSSQDKVLEIEKHLEEEN